MSENRIERTNTATGPAHGAIYVPKKIQRLVRSCIAGGLGAVSVTVTAASSGPDGFQPSKLNAGILIGAFVGGCAAGLAANWGQKSAGERKL